MSQVGTTAQQILTAVVSVRSFNINSEFCFVERIWDFICADFGVGAKKVVINYCSSCQAQSAKYLAVPDRYQRVANGRRAKAERLPPQ